MFIVKMTPQLSGNCTDDLDGTERYIYWGGQCNFKGYKPDKVVIQYDPCRQIRTHKLGRF